MHRYQHTEAQRLQPLCLEKPKTSCFEPHSRPSYKRVGLGWSLLVLWLLLVGNVGLAWAQSPPPTASPTFHKDVLPIFRTACAGCHSGAHPAGGLTLTSYADMMRGGNGGVPFVAGKSGDSKMVKMLLGTLQPQMPPGGGLKRSDIDSIRKWIDAGAPAEKEEPAKTKKEVSVSIVNGAGKRMFPLPASTALSHRKIPAPINALAFSPDAKTLAVGTYQEVQFWDVATQQRLGIWAGHAGAVHGLAFSRDGRWLAAGSGLPASNGQIKLWDMTTGREVRTLAGHDDVVNTVAFSPDGTRLVSGSVDKSIKIWEIATGKLLLTLRDHADAVWSVAYSPDGKYLASASADRSVKVWEASAGKRLYSIDAHDDIVYDVEFSPDGKSLLTAGGDNVAKLWAFGADSSTLVRAYGGHSQAVLAATFATDGQTMATASADHTVRVWRVGDGSMLKSLSGAKDWIYAVRFSPDGHHVAAGVWDGSLLLWNPKEGTLEATLSTLGSSAPAPVPANAHVR